MPDVVCLGILVADVVARPVDEYPARGELVVCEQMLPCIGGCASNTGIGLQKLGVETAIIGNVGRDGFGDFVRGELGSRGVDAVGVVTADEAATSATMVIVGSDGERSFIHCVGANATLKLDDIDWKLIERAKILHVAGFFLMPGFDGEPCAEVLRRAQGMGVKTCLDTAGRPAPDWAQKIAPCLPHLDYVAPSFSEIRYCVPSYGTERNTPQRVAEELLEAGVGVVALKMGEQGSYVRTRDSEWRVPAFKVEAVDATGAGDAFAAGFLAGLSHGYDLPQSAKLGNATGALCVQAVGATAGYRSLDETLAFMSNE